LTDNSFPQSLFPSTWAICTIGDAGESILGQTKAPPHAPGERFSYIRVANVQDGILDLDEVVEMPFKDPDRYTLRHGDVLLCEGQSKELVGRAAMYHGTFDRLLFQNHLIRFRPYAGIAPEYALAVFRAYQKSGIFSSVSKSTTNIANMSLARFRALPFPLPPTAIQVEIALNISSVQDSIDLIANAIESGMNELPSLVGVARNEAILSEGAATWGNGHVGTSRWPLVTLREVVAEDAPVVYGIVQPGPNVDEGVPYIRGLDLQDGYIDNSQLWHTTPEIAERYSRSAVSAGDILLNIIRHTRAAIVPSSLEGANITRTTARVRPGERATSSYLWHWLSSEAAQSWLKGRMRGIDMPGLNLRDVRELPVPVPPLSVQNQISRNLDEIVLRADGIRSSFSSLSEHLPDLEASLIESFAYGPAAVSISEKVPDNVQLQLAQELLESLAEEATSAEAAEKARRARRVEVSEDRSPEGGKSMQPAPKGRQVTNAEEVARALEDLGGRASPEDLYAFMRLAEAAVDSFYTSIRELVANSQLSENRPNNTAVFLEIATRA
jgi:type I restriction enzyme, S subunit